MSGTKTVRPIHMPFGTWHTNCSLFDWTVQELACSIQCPGQSMFCPGIFLSTYFFLKTTKNALSTALKCTKLLGRRGFAPDPTREAYSAPQTSLLSPLPPLGRGRSLRTHPSRRFGPRSSALRASRPRMEKLKVGNHTCHHGTVLSVTRAQQ